uniref:Uncharacterized protein n=1 Tax=Cacopsylla melanoneura TaxID=428564 RepID=A0A8D8XH81_9HEMI
MYTLYLSPHFMSKENSMLPVLYSGGCGSIPVTRYRDKGVLVETRSPCPSSYPCLVMTPCTDLRLHSLILTRRNPSPNQWRFVLWIWRRSIFSLRRVQDKRPPSLRRVQDKSNSENKNRLMYFILLSPSSYALSLAYNTK